MTDTTTTIPDQPDGIEDDSYDLPELGRAAERVREYICAWGDGLIVTADGHPLYARDLEALRRAADHVWAGEQLRDEVEKLRAALTQSRAQAATYANEIGALTAENARLRQQRDETPTKTVRLIGEEMTVEPGPEVTKAYDRDGDMWVRSPRGWRYRTTNGDGDPWPWAEVTKLYGPLSAHTAKAEATR